MSLKDVLSAEKLAELLNLPKKKSLAAIGAEYHVSRQRIHQLYREYVRQRPELFPSRKVPAAEEIRDLLAANAPLSKIAKKYSLSVGKLKKYMNAYGLKKEYLKEKLKRDELYRLYVELEMSDEKIARMYNCSPNTIMKLRYENQIYERMRRSLRERLTPEIFKELYEKEGLRLEQIASLFKANVQTVIRLKREYGITKARAKGALPERMKELEETLRKG